MFFIYITFISVLGVCLYVRESNQLLTKGSTIRPVLWDYESKTLLSTRAAATLPSHLPSDSPLILHVWNPTCPSWTLPSLFPWYFLLLLFGFPGVAAVRAAGSLRVIVDWASVPSTHPSAGRIAESAAVLSDRCSDNLHPGRRYFPSGLISATISKYLKTGVPHLFLGFPKVTPLWRGLWYTGLLSQTDWCHSQYCTVETWHKTQFALHPVAFSLGFEEEAKIRRMDWINNNNNTWMNVTWVVNCDLWISL